eukprot:jgi/Tetstr1/433147/TSEL_022479.t1
MSETIGDRGASPGHRARYYEEHLSEGFLSQLPKVLPISATDTFVPQGAFASSTGPVFHGDSAPPRAEDVGAASGAGFLNPSVDGVRQRAPTTGFGPRPKVQPPKRDERQLLQPSDELTRRGGGGVRFGPPPGATGGVPERERPGTAEAPRQALLLLDYHAVERAPPGFKFGPAGSRAAQGEGDKRERDDAEAEARAEMEKQLDVAAAKSRLLPRAATAFFSQSERFADAWNGPAGREGRHKLRDSAALQDLLRKPLPEEVADKYVRKRAPGVVMGPPPSKPPAATEKAVEGKTESSTEPAPLNPNFATVHRRVAGPTMRRPVTPPRRRPRAEQPAPGPGHYEPAPSEAPGAKASAWSRAAARAVAAPAGASGSAAKPAGATAYDVERGLALVRPAAPAIGFGPRSTQRPSRGPAKARESLEAIEDMDGSRRPPASSRVRYDLVERRPVAHSWGRPPARRDGTTVATEQGADARPDEREGDPRAALRLELNPNYNFGRPSTIVFDFSVLSGRELPRRRRTGEPRAWAHEPARYTAAQAWEFLQRHVPGPVFRMAADRWESGVLGAIMEGGQEVVLELAAAMRHVRPAPPAFTFRPVPSHRRRLPLHEGVQSELDVDITLAHPRIPGLHQFVRMQGRRRLRTGPQEWEELPDEEPPNAAAVGAYSPQHRLVEAAPPGALAFERHTGRALETVDVTGKPLEGDVLELDIAAGDAALRRQPAGHVEMARTVGRPTAAAGKEGAGLTASIPLPSPGIDGAVRPGVVSVLDQQRVQGHRGGHEQPDSWFDKQRPLLGPGTHETAPPPLGEAARKADFASAPGRGLGAAAEQTMAAGDRLELDVPSALDATRPRPPEALIPPEPSSGRNEPASPPPDPVYDVRIDAVRPRRAGAPVFDLMTAREAPSSRPVHLEAEYNPQDVPAGALAQYPPAPAGSRGGGVPFALQYGREEAADSAGRRADDNGARGTLYDLDVDSGLEATRWRGARAPVDMEKQKGHAASAALRADDGELAHNVYYEPREELVRPRVQGAAPIRQQLGRQEHTLLHNEGTGDLDAGCYEPSHRLQRKTAAAADFSRASERRTEMLAVDEDEGNVLMLHPRPVEGWRPRQGDRQSEQPFGRGASRMWSDRWAHQAGDAGQPAGAGHPDEGDNLAMPGHAARPAGGRPSAAFASGQSGHPSSAEQLWRGGAAARLARRQGAAAGTGKVPPALRCNDAIQPQPGVSREGAGGDAARRPAASGSRMVDRLARARAARR